MNDRVARTKTIETAWELRKLIMAACRFNEFVVLAREPDQGWEIVPLNAFHPLDREAAKRVVAEFVASSKPI